MDIVKKLSRLLEKTEMSQYRLAAIIGCPPATLNRWFNRKFYPSQSWLMAMKGNKELKKLLKEYNLDI